MAYEDEDLAQLRIPLIAIVDATNNFAEENLLKRGEKADVYKGVLTLFDAQISVVKLKDSGHLLNFYEDIKRIRSWHRNVVFCVGFCDEKDERLIVFEHVANGSLDKYLSDPIFLTWSQRLHICFGAALGLSNTLGSLKNFKILLDKDWEAKVLFCIESESKNSDLYCLGMILLEVLYGRNSTIEDVNRYLAEMAEKGELLDDVILPNLRTQMHTESLSIFAELAYNCLKEHPDQQSVYTFDQILKRLEQAIEIQEKHEKLRTKKLAWLKIPLSHIKLATDDFSDTYSIESRIYESVYKAELGHFDRESVLTIEGDNKGELPKKTVIIKRYNNLVKITKASFFAKIEMLSSCKHPNLLSFLGFCDEESEMILVFECAFKETLSDCFRRESTRANLTWEKRICTCLVIARALEYVDHNMESKPSMKSPVIESVSVFLDENSNAVIANFNVFEISPYTITSLWQPFWDSMDVPGIPSGQRLVVDDVYYLGVILFEILTGKLANRSIYKTGNVNGLTSIGILKNMVDSVIKEEAQHSLDAFSEITYQCLTGSPSQRPTLEIVIKSLEKALHIQVQKLGHIKIPLEEIKSATHNFDISNLIGSGGYGEVYKAELKLRSKDDHLDTPNIVAVKRITSRKDTQGIEGFFSELDVVSKCKHPNIVPLIGFCFEDGEMLLVYEFATNGSLDECLRNIDTTSNLTWAQRLKMCIDIAQGLNYMHTTMEDKKGMIRRDIKSANILLGKNWEAKIADFGLSKVHYGNKKVSTINTTTLAGTEFYLDPEYARTGRLKKASDIYSLGVVLFEIFSGKLAYDSNYIKRNEKGLPPIARRHFKRGTLKEILDPKTMDDTYELGFTGKVEPDQDSLDVFSRIGYQCVAKTQVKRPTIEVVIEELEKALHFQENRKKTLDFSLDHIRLGVENFSVANCIMRGRYGMLYKGKVQYNNRHKKVVVKRFSYDRHMNDTIFSWEHGFLKEFEVLFKHKHENVIGLVG